MYKKKKKAQAEVFVQPVVDAAFNHTDILQTL